MSFLGARNAISLGVSPHAVLSNGPILTRLAPSLLLQFAGAETLDPRITFTRSTTATYYDQSGVLSTAAINAPRFDYDPVTLAPKGLLIEEQRTNLLTYSEQFNNAAWVKGNSSVTANTIVAPDGTLTGDKLIEDTANTTHKVQQLQTKAASAIQYTASIYAKAAERTSCVLFLAGTAGEGNSCGATFDLLTGAVSSATNAGTFTGVSASSVAVGNGWYRLSVTGTSDTATSIYLTLRLRTTASIYTGDGYSGIYIWGAQLESGGFSTSYIPTVAAQVTRSADTAVMTGTNFSSWYRQDEGTLYAESSLFGNFINRDLVSLSNGTSSEEITIRWASGSQAQFVVDVNAVTQASIAPSGYSTAGVVYKRAAAYRVNDFEQAINGASVGTDTSGLVPVVNQMNFTGPTGLTGNLNGHIRKIAYYPRRLSSSNLQGITS